MECLEETDWDNYTEDELWRIKMTGIDNTAEQKVKEVWKR